MTLSATLRRAGPADAAAIASIHREARAVAMPWLAVVHTPAEVLSYFTSIVLVQAEVWGVETREGLVGFAAREGTELDHLYIAPGHWGRGLGRQLLSAVREGVPHLTCWTFQRNQNARAFYESHGFAAIDFTDGSRNEEREPDVRYLWEAA
ncbi:MAG: GNAT family N-acetyltransferase [Hyphomonas sp.]|nr:GNAT family N-acetyltransferase [Hyphomonas sp.]